MKHLTPLIVYSSLYTAIITSKIQLQYAETMAGATN